MKTINYVYGLGVSSAWHLQSIGDWRGLRRRLCVAAKVHEGIVGYVTNPKVFANRFQAQSWLFKNSCRPAHAERASLQRRVRSVNCKVHAKKRSVPKSQRRKSSGRLTFGMRSDRKILFEWHWLAQSFLCLCVLHFMHFSSSSSLYVLKRELLITVLGIRFYFTHNKFTWNIFKLLRVVESDKFMRHETFSAALWKKTLWG